MSRNYYQAFTMILSVAWATSGLFSGIVRPVESTYPVWYRLIWYTGLFIGGILVLVSIFLANYTGLLIERASMILICSVSTAYLIGFFIRSRELEHTLYVGSLMTIFVVLNLGRIKQINSEIRAIHYRIKRLGSEK